jgi:ABC-type amino acid transport system permease subunit
MKRANEVAAESYHYFEPLLVAALCYYILVL